ncbi:MAG: hypothetical protein U9N04_00485 [Patescibacteria group bacterium]|nr:hypothetical protein [Patescibacteria group bacterium]
MKRNTTKTLVVATLLIVALCATVTTASAGRIYASDTTTKTDAAGVHYGLVYNLEHSWQHPYVGGVDNSGWRYFYLYPHSNPQQWEWQDYGLGKSVLFIPERYIWIEPNYANEIYLQTAGGGSGGGGGGAG